MNIENKLKKFKRIKPDKDFVSRTERFILITPITNQNVFGLVFTSFSLVVLALAILVVNYWIKPVQISNLDQQILQKENQNLELNIQLVEIEYFQEINDLIDIALEEVRNHE